MTDPYLHPTTVTEKEKKLADKMLREFFKLKSLREVGKKNGVSYEWVRVVFVRNGYEPMEVKRALKDYEEWQKIDKKYKKCKCGKIFHLDSRRQRRNRLPDKCHDCFLKARYKLDGYRWQKAWTKKHPDKVREYGRRAGRKYMIKHREELNRKARIRYHKRKKTNEFPITNYTSNL